MAIAGIPPGFWVSCAAPAQEVSSEPSPEHVEISSLWCVQGVRETARSILAQDGIRGLYRGFGTVMLGAVPARVVSSLPCNLTGRPERPMLALLAFTCCLLSIHCYSAMHRPLADSLVSRPTSAGCAACESPHEPWATCLPTLLPQGNRQACLPVEYAHKCHPCCLQCYLSTLELVKSATMGVAGRLAANEAQQAGIANFVAGVPALDHAALPHVDRRPVPA